MYGGMEDLDNIYVYPLPADKMLINENEVKERLSAGESPISISLDKWRRIYNAIDWISTRHLPDKYMHNFSGKLGYTTCAMCLYAMKTYENTIGKMEAKSDKCKCCPLAKLDCCLEEGSSYKKVENLVKQIEANLVYDMKKSIEQLKSYVYRLILNLEICK